ncbi:hypothetical protein CRUP_020800 [Coryphaenoides rupestris]|nr:hypothetical protein CRUP_020800 [Coryphaenoides rupestris]
MQRLSRLHRDVPTKPLDHAIFWIEYVIRNKDVILFVLGLVLIMVLTFIVLLRRLCLCVAE